MINVYRLLSFLMVTRPSIFFLNELRCSIWSWIGAPHTIFNALFFPRGDDVYLLIKKKKRAEMFVLVVDWSNRILNFHRLHCSS